MAIFIVYFSRSFPFDSKTPNGYLVAIIWQYVGTLILLRFLACLVPLALSFFIIAYTGTQDWKYDLHKLKKAAKNKQSHAEIFNQLTEFIRSHARVKQLSQISSVGSKFNDKKINT